MENQPTDSLGPKLLLGFFWLISLAAVGYAGFAMGHATKLPEEKTEKEVLTALASKDQLSPVVTNTVQETTAKSPNTPACEKSGYAQKWEFLDPYVVQEKDTIQAIAASELGDASRSNEIMQINGLPLVAGSTIYLPPPVVPKTNR